MSLKSLQKDEQTVIGAMLDSILKRDLLISVFDIEGEGDVRSSKDRKRIEDEIGITSLTKLHVHEQREDGNYFAGAVWFVHGNGAEVVSNMTVSPLMDAIWEEVLPVIDATYDQENL